MTIPIFIVKIISHYVKQFLYIIDKIYYREFEFYLVSLNVMSHFRIRQTLTLGDKVLIGCLLLLSLASFPLVRIMTKAGNSVQIETDGNVYKVVSLHADQTLVVPGPLGKTIVVVHDGEVHVTDSPCRVKICVRMGNISHIGQLIVCVPNKVVVRVTGEEELPYDAVTQ